eukprot:Amastigsp_a175253_354.p2 type:complete len:119 gc:universal Amastigsp_a175253_354:535-179(-)
MKRPGSVGSGTHGVSSVVTMMAPESADAGQLLSAENVQVTETLALKVSPERNLGGILSTDGAVPRTQYEPTEPRVHAVVYTTEGPAPPQTAELWNTENVEPFAFTDPIGAASDDAKPP